MSVMQAFGHAVADFECQTSLCIRCREHIFGPVGQAPSVNLAEANFMPTVRKR